MNVSAYPRPQLRRQPYVNLDGPWEYVLPDGETGTILVPYVYQCKASGIGKMLPDDRITYQRTFQVPKEWRAHQVRLHFGAVDYFARVFVNGQLAASHEGGQTPFSCDIQGLLNPGEDQLLRVEVWDRREDQRLPRGKQSWQGEGEWIFYRPSTGIWQTVWMECVPENGVHALRLTPDVDAGVITMDLEMEDACQFPCQANFHISLQGQAVAEASLTLTEQRSRLSLDVFHGKVENGTHFTNGLCWSPETPTLFDLTVEICSGGNRCDWVESYFGMRKISCVGGKLYLNNHPYAQKLVLDQGYWPDGQMTPPNVDAFATDILGAKALGFNGCRKHEKAEDPRFLYQADKLGYLVWGSTASFYRYDEVSASRHLAEWSVLLKRDYNHPCIVCWDVLNESWGVPAIRSDKRQQRYATALYSLAHALDGTRPVVSNDGWEMTETDICALHSYQHGGPGKADMRKRFIQTLADLDTLSASGLLEHHQAFASGYRYLGQPIVLSEYGGLSLGQGNGWGYENAENEEEFLADYEDLMKAIVNSGLFCGFCYTQLTDVQQEQNGLMDAQRRFKVNPERMKAIHDLMR